MTTYPKANLGPRNPDEEQTFAEEAFRVDLQVYIHALMERKGISTQTLACKMGTSPAGLTKLVFSDSAKLEARTVARVFFLLGETPKISIEKKKEDEACYCEACDCGFFEDCQRKRFGL